VPDPERVAIALPVEDGLAAADYVGLAELAERCGYDAVLAGEVAGPEVFGLLGMIAARTTSIRIGSGIVGCYARPPALTAMGFAALASGAPGRVIAGVGMVPTHQASFRGVFPALDEAAAAWGRRDRRAALRLVGDDTVHALCAIGAPGTVAGYVPALRAAGIDLPVVLTPGAAPGDVAGSRATITGLAEALRLPA
jgi:hypothetical protein